MQEAQSIWIPFAVGAAGAFIGAFCAIVGGELRESWQRKRIRRGHFEALAAELRMCGAIAAGYIEARVKSPAYRMPLIGHERSLAPLLADGELSQNDCEALMRYYVNALDFNRCLDYCHDAAFVRTFATDSERERALNEQVKRAILKAEKLQPGLGVTKTHYGAVIEILRRHLPREALVRLNFDASEPR